MSTYRDIINRMERNGDYSAARDYEDALREHGHSEYDRADRYNPADGARYSHAGNCAEQAYRDIERSERNEQERRGREAEERRQAERAHERHMEEQLQQQEEEHWAQKEAEEAASHHDTNQTL